MAKRKWSSGGICVTSKNGEPPPNGLEIFPHHYRGIQTCVEDFSKSSRSKGWKYADPSVWLQLTPKAARRLYRDLGKMLRLVRT